MVAALCAATAQAAPRHAQAAPFRPGRPWEPSAVHSAAAALDPLRQPPLADTGLTGSPIQLRAPRVEIPHHLDETIDPIVPVQLRLMRQFGWGGGEPRTPERDRLHRSRPSAAARTKRGGRPALRCDKL